MSGYVNDTHTDVPTRSDDPEVIRREIEATRAELSRDVDALTEKVSPTRVMARRVGSAKGAASALKERIMGSSSDPYDTGAVGTASGTASGLMDKASSVASSVGQTAAAAPSTARQQVQGNPLAAGLIAFGVGWLASSLLPASDREQQAATTLKDKASEHSDTLTAPLKQAAGGARESLAAPAREAMESVKSKAAEAAGTVRGEAASAKETVAGSAQQAKDDVQQSSSTT